MKLLASKVQKLSANTTPSNWINNAGQSGGQETVAGLRPAPYFGHSFGGRRNSSKHRVMRMETTA